MKKGKSKQIVIILILTGLLLSGCAGLFAKPTPTPTPTPVPPTPTPTPVPISDEGFAELALGTCEELKSDLEDIEALTSNFIDDYAMKGEAFQKAADALADFTVTAEFAPQASIFISSLTELAEVYRDFAVALSAGMDNQGLTLADTSYVAISEDDRVFVFTDVWVDLEIDVELVSKIGTVKNTYQAAAQALGLDACAIE